MKARRGSIKRAAQDIAPLFAPLRDLAYWAHEGEIPIDQLVKLVRAAYRGEAKQRASD